MALTPELKTLKDNLQAKTAQSRTPGQQRLLDELLAIDTIVLRKSIEEATFSSDTRMTSPGGGCPCCGS